MSDSVESSRSVERAKTFPLLQQTHEFLAQLPACRILEANAKPIISSIASSKPAKWASPAAKVADNIADKGLEFAENWAPSLKTKTYQDLCHDALVPFNYSKETVGKAANVTLGAADTYVYEPAHARMSTFRQFYNEKVYDTNGKPLIRGSIDPLVAPCNKRLEAATKAYFPDGEEVPSNGYNTEFSRTLALSANFVQRAVPWVNRKVTDLAMAPYNYTSHVNAVFNHSLDKQENLSLTNSWAATREALCTLNQEALQYAKPKGNNPNITAQ
ncbi:LAQU0S02e01002g1_1 [Lachancea quebecensis]|uniref:LAQU0S02e01002g1_1 n=1 Tax=Lachancea quebecensis TaxID=1654605 RepID=A0A0N7ML01_9SACH|nr:LAQU0S02e01002g1_1 [Lachancea quebecensis]